MRMFLLVTATVLATGCSAVMHPGSYRSGYYGRRVAPVADSAPVGRWDLVMRLAAGTTIDVLTRSGHAHVGGFAGADETEVRLTIAGAETFVLRTDIVRIDLVDLPGSTTGAVAKRAGLGALLGTAASVVIAGVIGSDAWPPPGAMLRAGAAAGAVTGGEAALIERRQRVIYLAPAFARP